MLSKTIVKYIQSLNHKKFRDEYGVFIAEGPKVAEELLLSKIFKCKMLCAEKSWMGENKELAGAAEQFFEITASELKRISQLQTPNQVLAVFYKKEMDTVAVKGNLSLMLDDLQDPGNMGSIIRTADWFGIKNIICSNECVDCYNPKVVQASMGSLARVNIIYTVLENFIKKSTVPVFAATLSGENIFSFKKKSEGIILIGNESKGIKKELSALSEKQITIPKLGDAESLNAAVACGIILSRFVYGNTL